jgi:hypothetical protein
MRRQLFLIFFLTACSVNLPREPAQTSAATPPRILLLGLDGIGFTQFKKMQNGGHFRSFRPVSPMVASFPSISDPNWAKIMRTPAEISFTKEHFDRTADNGKGRLVGGLMDHVLRPPLYESYFDFKPEGVVQHIASMTYSETTGLYWIDVLEKKLLEATGKKIFSAFIVNTDFIAHTKGEDAIYRYLGELDKKIEQLRTRYHEKFGKSLEVVLISDHGNVFLKPKSVNVETVLSEDHWNISQNLTSEKDVVFVVPEILSFAPFFVLKGGEQSLAKTLSRAVGVHVALYLSSPTEVDFYSRDAKDHTRAMINTKNKTINYKIIKGQDPFSQIQYFKNGPVSMIKYFQDTLNDDYPNALVRAWEGLSQNTIQSPSVLVSPSLGYVFSNKTLELITKVTGLESVHGSFHREETSGILVSTDRDLPPVFPSVVLDFVN